MSRPTVSIVIPTYNQPRLLQEALESVFAQTFNDYEVIVVNDGSTDDTLEQLTRIAANRPQLRVVTQVNGGTGAARNRGIDEACGEFIALLDHDDWWLGDKLKLQVQFLREHPQCACAVVPYAASNSPHVMGFDLSKVCDADGIVRRPFRKIAEKHALLITCSTLMFPKAKAAGLRFGTERGAIEDVPFQIGLLSRGELGVAGTSILAIYRFHDSNTSSQASYFERGIRLLRQMDAANQFAQLSPDAHADMLGWLGFLGRAAAVSLLLHGERRRAWAAFLKEIPHQLGQRQWKFVGGFPILALAPEQRVRRWASRAG